MLQLGGTTLSICVWWKLAKVRGGSPPPLPVPNQDTSLGSLGEVPQCRRDKYAFHTGLCSCCSRHLSQVHKSHAEFGCSELLVKCRSNAADLWEKLNLVTSLLSYRMLVALKVSFMRVSYLRKHIRFLITYFPCKSKEKGFFVCFATLETVRSLQHAVTELCILTARCCSEAASNPEKLQPFHDDLKQKHQQKN